MQNDIENVVSIYVNEQFQQFTSDHLTFHNISHVLDVVKAVTLIGKQCAVSKEDIRLLRIAAWFHDTGFTARYQNHEAESIAIARDFLGQLNCEPRFINDVAELIEATRMPQKPKNLLAEIICDADLAHLAKKSYKLYETRLRKEWAYFLNKKFSAPDWRQFNLAFLKNHRYFTTYGKLVLQKQKEDNIEKLSLMK